MFRFLSVVVGILLVALSTQVVAHDIPADITIHAFIKPEGRQLRLLMRVPLGAIVDVDYPRRGPGYLDLARADASLQEAATRWMTDFADLYEGGARLGPSRIIATRVSLPSDKSFGTYEEAIAHILRGPRLPTDTELYWNQGLLDMLVEYPIQSPQSEFAIETRLERLGLRVTTVLRFLPDNGLVRAFQFHGDPGFVRLDPRWHQAALRFVDLGFEHILGGIDHLLFLACLVIPFRRVAPLVLVVTSFTVAHSVTLIASAFNIAPTALWFPPLVETLIAISIVYMGLENIVGWLGSVPGTAPYLRRRWLIAFGFGLIHGFGFSFALRESLQFAGSHLLTSLLSFNVGVELGQLVVLAALIPMLGLLFRFVVVERAGTIIMSALLVHTAWHWMTERGTQLVQYQFQWPVFDALWLAAALRWLILLVVVAAMGWLVFVVLRPRLEPSLKDDVAGTPPRSTV